MARLTVEQWSKVQADYATGRYTNRDLAGRYDTSHTAIQNRARKEGWQKLEADMVNDFVKAKATMHKEVSKVSKVSKLDPGNFNSALDELTQFEILSNERMAEVENKAMYLLDDVENPVHVKAIMETLVKHREARLGKSPDTAIQINNTQPSNALTGEDLRRELDKRGINSEVFD